MPTIREGHSLVRLPDPIYVSVSPSPLLQLASKEAPVVRGGGGGEGRQAGVQHKGGSGMEKGREDTQGRSTLLPP